MLTAFICHSFLAAWLRAVFVGVAILVLSLQGYAIHDGREALVVELSRQADLFADNLRRLRVILGLCAGIDHRFHALLRNHGYLVLIRCSIELLRALRLI